MNAPRPTSLLDIAVKRAQSALDAAIEAGQKRTRGLDERDAFRGNVTDAKDKLFGDKGLVNSLQALPDDDKLAFVQQALEGVKLGSKGKKASIALQTAFITSLVETFDKAKGASANAFAATAQDDLRDTVAAPLPNSAAKTVFAETVLDPIHTPSDAVAKNGSARTPHIAKESLEYASGKALEAMAAASHMSELAFIAKNKDVKGATAEIIQQEFATRFAATADALLTRSDSVVGKLRNAQSNGQVKLILDGAYATIAKHGKTMAPVVESTLDGFVAALSEKESGFSYQKPGKQRGA